jgi:predicted CoA-binding protein
VPVNPREPEVDGVPAVPSLREAGPIDVVDVFRRSEAVPEIVDEVLELGLPVLWLQPGAENAEAAARAAAAGVVVVSGRCLMAEHRRLLS